MREIGEMPEKAAPGPCRTEFSDVGFDFIVVGTGTKKFDF